jgi:hypothetical protein
MSNLFDDQMGYTQRKLRHRTSLFCPFGGFYCMTKFKIQAEIAQFNNLKLINSFCNLINDDTETLEQTAERFVGSPEYNTCEVFEIADMYLSLYDVLQFYLLDCTLDQFQEWYWWTTEQHQDNKPTMNLKHWLIAKK